MADEDEHLAGREDYDSQELQKDDCSFVWDEQSQLYFHASTGFYHDANAGWYYSSRDGLYYKFEDGNYVLLESKKADDWEVCQANGIDGDCSQVGPSSIIDNNEFFADESKSFQAKNNVPDVSTHDDLCNNAGYSDSGSHQGPENPPPPSEWLEDTLIDLYLSGYSNPSYSAADETSLSINEGGNGSSLLEEGEWIPEHNCGTTDSSGNVIDEGASWEEENWRAQYGQVIKSVEETAPAMPVLDLWDWKTVSGVKKDGKRQVIRLVGRVVRQSAKLHPSMPSSASLLKTAPICETHLDLVRVRSGQVYKLRTPSTTYLNSLLTYDSSNPTNDWDFPELSINEVSKPSGICQSKATDKVLKEKFSTLQDDVSASRKHNGHAYRDRAAERRALHGGVGIGPGQKWFCDDVDQPPSTSYSTDESAAEAWNMSFGADSYARKIMKTMGWKEGTALGKTQTGLVEPLRTVGNKGNAGLGWPHGRT